MVCGNMGGWMGWLCVSHRRSWFHAWRHAACQACLPRRYMQPMLLLMQCVNLIISKINPFFMTLGHTGCKDFQGSACGVLACVCMCVASSAVISTHAWCIYAPAVFSSQQNNPRIPGPRIGLENARRAWVEAHFVV